ncbi:MAG: hypothetical protein MZV70_39080 [Desulfobacterales bacterium]|nr:hypothetical protein [Desulfobacterales bacterium]
MTEQAILLTEVRGRASAPSPSTGQSGRMPCRRNCSCSWSIRPSRSGAVSDEVRVVVITGGTGKAFSSGYDIAAIPTEMNPGAGGTHEDAATPWSSP